MRTGLIVIVFLALAALVGSSMFYVVDEREHAILMYFGRPAERAVGPGLHFKWPIINTVQKYDRRLRVFATPAITQTLQDKKTIILQAYLCWRISDPLRFYESVRYLREAEQKLNDIASSALGSIMGRYPITSIISVEAGQVRLAQIEREMRDYMTTALSDTYGITVERFGISRLALPEANQRSVYERMKTEREIAATKYREEGKSEAKQIRAAAEERANNIESQAAAEAKRIRGEGEAKAAQIYRDAYSKDLEFYRFWRTLETYKKIFGAETTLVIPADCELMKYFMMPSLNRTPKKSGE